VADPARIAALTAALADAVASNAARVAWRTLAGEAAARGFPTQRAFREWCQRAGVTIREVSGVALVDVGEVDRVGLAGAARPVPPSARSASVVAAEIDDALSRAPAGRR
jgi:hypothetical protein